MVAAGIKIDPPDQLLIYMQKRAGGNWRAFQVLCKQKKLI